MFFDEEELLEAVDILIEDYGYDENEAIDILVESFDEYEDEEIDDEELENMLEAVDFLMEEYGYDEDEAMDIISEGFLSDLAKKRAKKSMENTIENTKNNIKQGLDERKMALKGTVNYGLAKRKSGKELSNMTKNPSNSTPTQFRDKKYEHSKNIDAHNRSTQALKNYAYKDRKIIGGVALAGAGLLAHRAMKKRRLRKEVRKIMAKEAARR